LARFEMGGRRGGGVAGRGVCVCEGVGRGHAVRRRWHAHNSRWVGVGGGWASWDGVRGVGWRG
jgi:hypothetical protein